jgi:hypothetical protein
LTTGSPQQNTKPVRKIHGSHAFQAGPVAAGVTPVASGDVDGAGGLNDSSFGFQKRINTTSAPIDTAALTMSTSQGP